MKKKQREKKIKLKERQRIIDKIRSKLKERQIRTITVQSCERKRKER